MRPRLQLGTVGLALLALALAPPGRAAAGFVVTTAAGPNAAAIQATVDQFRLDLGNPNNGNAPGPLAGGRREINWDGGGSDVTAFNGNPFTVFENTRGATATTPGTGFFQAPPSGGPQGGLATAFGNPTYGTIFTTFSDPRLFVPSGSNITDVFFSVPGTGGTAPAGVSGFGAVFADVDLANTTTIQYFGVDGSSLGTFSAPTFNNGLSFLGVRFDAGELIGRVRITTGNSALGPNDGGGIDVVAMDDFFYAEPQAIPEVDPGSAAGALALALGGVAVVTARRRRADVVVGL